MADEKNSKRTPVTEVLEEDDEFEVSNALGLNEL